MDMSVGGATSQPTPSALLGAAVVMTPPPTQSPPRAFLGKLCTLVLT